MRTLTLAAMLFLATPGMTAPPSVDDALRYYDAMPWLKAESSAGTLYCVKPEQAQAVDAIVLFLHKAAKGLCV